MQPLLYFTVVMSFVMLLTACSDPAPADSMVQYFVTNKSSAKIDRLTIFLETQENGSPRLTDSVYITNLPENLSVRLTYDLNKNTSANGIYKLIALSNDKNLSNTFGTFSGKTDGAPDHTYHLEILKDSIVVIP